MSLTAVELDPPMSPTAISAAHVLMQMERLKDGEAVLHRGSESPRRRKTASVQDFSGRSRPMQQRATVCGTKSTIATKDERTIRTKHRPETPEEKPPAGTHRFLAGKFQDVRCRGSAIDLILVAKGKTMALHSGNYYKLAFNRSRLLSPKSDINPCHDLEGASAKIEYVDFPYPRKAAYVFAIELHQ